MYREAKAELGSAAGAAAALGDPYTKALIEVNWGWLEYDSADYGKDWIHFKQAESLASAPIAVEASQPKASRIEVRTMALSGLGAVCWATARYRQALEYYRAQAAILHENAGCYEEVGPR